MFWQLLDSFMVALNLLQKKARLETFQVYVATNITIKILSNIFFLAPFCTVSKWNSLENILTKVLLDQELQPTKHKTY
jgi:TRAP-type mannitol/chloroaromatic compound transport system permease small subunit